MNVLPGSLSNTSPHDIGRLIKATAKHILLPAWSLDHQTRQKYQAKSLTCYFIAEVDCFLELIFTKQQSCVL